MRFRHNAFAFTKIALISMMMMFSTSCLIPLSELPVETRAERIAGTYERSPLGFHTTILLREDFTFDMILLGHLFTGERSTGTWQFTDEGYLELNCEPGPRVEEKNMGWDNEIQIHCRTLDGDLYGWALGQASCPEEIHIFNAYTEITSESESTEKFWNDENCTVHIPGCKPSSISMFTPGQQGIEWKPKDPDSDDFTFVFDMSNDFYVSGEIYKLANGHLYQYEKNDEDDSGSWSEYPFERISRKVIDPMIAYKKWWDDNSEDVRRNEEKKKRKAHRKGRKILDVLHEHFTVCNIKTWLVSSVDLDGEYFHAEIRRPDLPQNLFIGMDLEFIDKRIITSDSMIELLNSCFDRIMSVEWIHNHLLEYPEETIEIRYVNHGAMSDKAIEFFMEDVPKSRENCTAFVDSEILRSSWLLEVSGSQSYTVVESQCSSYDGVWSYSSRWLLLPDNWTLMWEMNGPNLLGLDYDEIPEFECFGYVSPEGELIDSYELSQRGP